MDDEDPEAHVHKYLQSWYENKYFSSEFCKINDAIKSKIWNLCFEETYDIIFIFQANIKDIQGERIPLDNSLAKKAK